MFNVMFLNVCFVRSSVLALCLCVAECFEREQSFIWRHDVQRDFLDVCFVRRVQSAEPNFVANVVRQKGFQSSPVCRSRANRVAPLLKRLDQAQVAHTIGGPRMCPRPSCRTLSA